MANNDYNSYNQNNISDSNPTIVCGKLQRKGFSQKNGKPFSIFEYMTESGVTETLYCDDACERFNINDPVMFTVVAGPIKPFAKIVTNYIGRVVRPKNLPPYIERYEGSKYDCDELPDTDAEYVCFFVKKPFDARKSIRGEAIGILPQPFPASLAEDDRPAPGRYTGQISAPLHPNQQFVSVITDDDCRVKNHLMSRYSFFGASAEWFFTGNRVTFELSSEKDKNGYFNAVNLKKSHDLPQEVPTCLMSDILTRVPADLFSEPLEETAFRKTVLEINSDFKSGIYSRLTHILDLEETLEELNIGSPHIHKSNIIAALKTITSSLYLNDAEYKDLLPRFKPFFDGIVPYLYANKLGEHPSADQLEWCVTDFCDYLNTLFRAQRADNPLDIEIDRKDALYPKFAEIIRYYVFQKSMDLSDGARLNAALVLTGQSGWSSEDTLQLLQNSVWEDVYQSPTESNIQALFDQTNNATHIGKLCDLLWKKEQANADALNGFLHTLSSVFRVCGREALDAFTFIERSNNDELLNDACHLVQDEALSRYINETCNRSYASCESEVSPDLQNTAEVTEAVIRAFDLHGLGAWPLPYGTSELTNRLMEALYEEAQTFDSMFNHKLVAALMILYAKDQDFLRARFLYSHFIRHRTIKNRPLFRAIRQEIGREKENEYSNEVVYYAFTHLPSHQLYAFTCWAGPLFTSPWGGNYICDISDHGNNSKGSVYSYYFAKILLGPTDYGNWNSLCRWLLKEQLLNYKNKFLFCAGQTILHNQFNLKLALSKTTPQLILLLKTTNPTHKKEFPALLYYTCEHIQKGFDRNHEVAECLLGAIGRDMVSVPVANDPFIDSFCDDCRERISELKSPLFANLLIQLKSGRLTAEDVLLVSPLTTDTDFISRELINAYEKVHYDTATTDALLSALKSVSGKSAYTAGALHDVWRHVVFGDRYSEEYASLHSEEFNALQQACVDILKTYPAKDKLIACLDTEARPIFKLLLHESFVGLYSENTVGKLFKNILAEIDTEWLYQDSALLHAYLACLDKQCHAELHFNTAYEKFYKYRRYVKLMLIAALRKGKDGMDESFREISAVVKQHRHQSLVDSFGFESFVLHLKELLAELEAFDKTHRTHLLISLLTEDMTSYFQRFRGKVDGNRLPSLKKIFRHFDYREFHSNFFISSYQPMLDGHFDTVLEQAALLSDEMYEVVSYLSGERDADTRLELLRQAREFLDQKAIDYRERSKTVTQIIDMSSSMSRSQKKFWAHVIYARQLPSKIVGDVRKKVLDYTSDPAEDKDDRLDFALDILGNMSDKNASYYWPYAEDCENYLSCLYDYFRGDVKQRRVERIQPHLLPEEWVCEAERFQRQYDSGTFIPDHILNRSFGNADTQLAFPKLARKVLGIRSSEGDDLDLSFDEMVGIIQDDGIDGAIVDVEGLIAKGLLWFASKRPTNSSEYKTYALALGKLIHLYEKAPAHLKLRVWLELFQRYKMDAEDFVRYLDDISSLLTIEDWLNHHEAIFTIIPSAFEVAHACCSDLWNSLNVTSLDKEHCSEAQLLEALDGIIFDSYGSEDDYLRVIHRALESKKDELSARRLTVNYEGAREAYAYFSVKNEGLQSINLKERLEINNGFVTPEVGLDELRPGWITGFKCRASNNGELTVVIKSEDKEALPLHREKCSVQFETPALTDGKRQFYNENALSDQEELFGRKLTLDEIQDHLHRFGYVVITGPSRVGKTSIINHAVSVARRHNARTYAITEVEHYVDHFTGRARSIDSLAEYLLIDTLLYGIRDEAVNRIIESGQSSQKPIRDIYVDVIQHLTDTNKEIWLIFDEFQQVVHPEEQTVDERAKKSRADQMSHEDMETLHSVLKKLMELPDKKIKIIFCGSDRLHKEINVPNSAWRNTLKAGQNNGIANWVAVNSISKDAFADMLAANGSVSYTPDAVEAAASYSSCIPLYGKLICNQAIRNSTSHKFFCYDIAAAVNALFTGNDVMGIIEPVHKGLGRKDVLYLSYLAKSLARGKTSEDIKAVLEDACGGEAVRASLNYARTARLLLNENEDQPDFSSVFFYKVFCQYEESKPPRDILAEIKDGVDKGVDDAVNLIQSLSDDQQSAVLLRGVFSREKLQYLSSTNIQVEGDYISGDKTEQNVSIGTLNLQINQQLVALLAEENFLTPGAQELFNKLFGDKGSLSISRFLSDSTVAQLQACSDPDEPVSPEVVAEVENARVQQATAMMSAVSFNDLLQLDDNRWQELLGVDTATLASLKELTDYTSSLGFAIAIHHILSKIYDKAEEDQRQMIDFSPVAILYCKIVEKMLNDTHRPLYEQYLYDYPCAQPDRNGEYTIGNFYFALLESNKNPFDWKNCQQELARCTKTTEAKWQQHAWYLREIGNIRNDTAHIDPINHEKFNDLIELMFPGNIEHIIEKVVQNKFAYQNKFKRNPNYQRDLQIAINATKRSILTGNDEARTGALLLIWRLGTAGN